MSNISGGINIVISSAQVAELVTSAGLSAKDYTTSTQVSAAIKNFITSASASVLVSTVGAANQWISSASASILADAIASTKVHNGVGSVQSFVVTAGAVVTCNPGTDILFIDSSGGGTLASITVIFATAGVITNQELRIAAGHTITSASTSGATLVGTFTGGITANRSVLYYYDGTNWVRIE